MMYFLFQDRSAVWQPAAMNEVAQINNSVHWESEQIDDFDAGNNSSRLFERSRIKALAGWCIVFIFSFLIIIKVFMSHNNLHISCYFGDFLFILIPKASVPQLVY